MLPPTPTPAPSIRYDTRRDVEFAKDAPVIGLVMQRSHLVTGDEGHYAGVVRRVPRAKCPNSAAERGAKQLV
jgi:hypothetical protein